MATTAPKETSASRFRRRSGGGSSKGGSQQSGSDGGSVPTFGNWNGDQNYTAIFEIARDTRKGDLAGGGPGLETASGGRGSGGSGDLYKPVQDAKKPSSAWCCFRGA